MAKIFPSREKRRAYRAHRRKNICQKRENISHQKENRCAHGRTSQENNLVNRLAHTKQDIKTKTQKGEVVRHGLLSLHLQGTSHSRCRCMHGLENMVQEIPHKSLALLTRRQQLGQQVCFIVVGVDVRSTPLIASCSLLYKMLRNAQALLLKSRIRESGVGQYRLVITTDISWGIARDAQHS